MDVLILLFFVSLVLVVGALVLFARGLFRGDFEHGDRLALLPLESDRIDPMRRKEDATTHAG